MSSLKREKKGLFLTEIEKRKHQGAINRRSLPPVTEQQEPRALISLRLYFASVSTVNPYFNLKNVQNFDKPKEEQKKSAFLLFPRRDSARG